MEDKQTVKKSYIALIPVYKTKLPEDEIFAVNRYRKVLTKGDISFIAPEGLDITAYKEVFPEIGFVFFDPKYFKGIRGYNHLMLSVEFYRRFKAYEYLLIAQTDAVIWGDEDRIGEFIARGYDYYGAPWIPERRIWEWTFPKKRGFPGFFVRCCKKKGSGIVMGNGGFSLRKVDSCIRLIREYSFRKIYWFIKRNEDIFFGVFGSDNHTDFRLADVECGMEFAAEYHLRERVLEKKIPYAVHGWKKDFKDANEMIAFLKENGIDIGTEQS